MIDVKYYDMKELKVFVNEGGGERKIVQGPKPYCFVEKRFKDYLANHFPNLHIENSELKTFKNEEVIKVVGNNLEEIKYFRTHFPFQTYEADVNYLQRYILDTYKLPIQKVPIHILYFDIETDMGLDPEKAEKKVIMIGFWDSKKREYEQININDMNEEEMLREFSRIIMERKIDMMVGWNSSNYDIPYLKNRAKRLGVYELVKSLSFVVNFDLLEFYKKIKTKQLTSYSLNNVAMEELGRGKLKININKGLNVPIKKMVEYNRRDVELLVELDEKLKIINYFDELRRVTGTRWDGLLSNSLIADSLFLYEARKEGYVLPTKPEKIVRERKIKGAYVYAKKGVYKNVCVVDANALYPSILMSFNMDNKTITKNIEEKNVIRIREKGIGFRKDVKGFIPEIIKRMIEVRKEYKRKRDASEPNSLQYHEYDMKQFALKTIINTASYGALLYPRFRLHNERIGEAIPFIGQQLIKHVRSVIEKEGHEVILIDTDSCFFVGSVEEGKRVQEVVNRSFDKFAKKFNIDKHFFKVKFEKWYEKLLIATKKRYAGRLKYKEGVEVNKFDITGMDIVRTDVPKYFKQCMRKMIDMILDGKSKEELKKAWEEMVNDLPKQNITDIAYPKAIQKPLNKYKTINPAQQGAITFNNLLNIKAIGRGAKVKWIYTKYVKWKGRVIRTKSIAWTDEYEYLLGKDLVIVPNYERLSANLKTMLNRILEIIGLKGEELGQKTLIQNFFKTKNKKNI